MATKGKRSVTTEVATNNIASTTDKRPHGPSLNRVSLIGRLTANPKFRYTPNGIAVANFRIANNGTDEVQVDSVVVWRKLAEITAEHLSKGRLVYIGGRLNSRSWTAQDGTERYALDIVADDILFLTPKPAAAALAA
jgi:single-strand DNA-binding protein